MLFLKKLFAKCKLLLLFLICTCIVNISPAKELKTYSEQKEIAQRIVDIFHANYGKIKSLVGTMEITIKKFDINDKNKLLSHYESSCSYVIDQTTQEILLINSPTISIFYKNGQKVDSPLFRQAMLWYDNCFYYSGTYSFMRDSVHPDSKKNFVRQLQIRAIPDPDLLLYYPLFKWTPSGSPTEVPDYFETISKKEDDNTKMQSLMQKRNISEEEAKKVWDDWKKNGVPGVVFELDGLILKRTAGNESNTKEFLVDLSKGAMIINYENIWKTKETSQKWECEMQKISGIWVPKFIRNELFHPEQEIEVTEIVFQDQKINTRLTQDDFSVAKLGVRQGDKGYDHRTDTFFIVEGDEFPLPEGMETPFSRKNQIFRIVLISLGVLLIILGGSGTLRKIYKKSA